MLRSLRNELLVDTVIGALARKERDSPPSVVGHRGALYDMLENTRAGFRHCAEMGCDAVELDVYLLKDGTLIVFHGGGTDENPGDVSEYCTNQDNVNILDLTYEDCLQLEFDACYDGFPCPSNEIAKGEIPTLEEVLLVLKPTKTQVKIELKGPGTVKPTLEVVERLGMVNQCQYGCYELDRLGEVRGLRPQVDPRTGQDVYQTGALFGGDLPKDYIEQAMAVGASEVHLRYDLCTAARVCEVRQAGMRSMIYLRGPVMMALEAEEFSDIGNEDELCYQALVDTGVDQLCVNRPDVLVRMLNKGASSQ